MGSKEIIERIEKAVAKYHGNDTAIDNKMGFEQFSLIMIDFVNGINAGEFTDDEIEEISYAAARFWNYWEDLD